MYETHELNLLQLMAAEGVQPFKAVVLNNGHFSNNQNGLLYYLLYVCVLENKR